MLLRSRGCKWRVQMESCVFCLWAKCRAEGSAGGDPSVPMSQWTLSQPPKPYRCNCPPNKIEKESLWERTGSAKSDQDKDQGGRDSSSQWQRLEQGHDFVLPGEKAPERKTVGSHAHCCCNDRECEGVGNISHHVYIKLYCNRGTICDPVSYQISHFSLSLSQSWRIGSPKWQKTTCLGTIFSVESSSSEVCGLSRITSGIVSGKTLLLALTTRSGLKYL